MNAKFLTDLDPDIKNELEGIVPRVGKILGRENAIFTDHSIQHSFRVLKNVDKIMDSEMSHFEPLSDNEKLCLAGACLLHDIGLGYELSKSNNRQEQLCAELAKDPIKIRERHAQSSGFLIKSSLGIIKGEDFLNLGLKSTSFSNIGNELVWICEQHSGTLLDKTILTSESSISGDVFRKGLLLSVLRLADELDRTYERVEITLLNYKDIPPASMLHWYINYYTKALTIEKGIIRLHVRYPELPSPAPSKLVELIKNKIKMEYDIVRIPLQHYGIGIQFDDINIEHSMEQNLNTPSIEVLQLLTGVEDTTRRQMLFTDISDTSNWMHYWKINGNPCMDKLLGPDDDLFIMTDSIKTIISETISMAQSSTGGVKLIIAQRRGGKTTLYHVMNDILKGKNYQAYNINTINIGHSIRSGLELFHYVLKRSKEIAETISGRKIHEHPDKIEEFRIALKSTESKTAVIFIDNLDRLRYEDKDEKQIIFDFLKQLQNITDVAQNQWYILVCVPSDWLDMLRQEPFLYLRPKVSNYLKGFTPGQTRELLKRRMNRAGRSIDDIITKEATDKLCEVSVGLPGLILQNVEFLLKHGAEEGVPKIDGKEVEEAFSTDLIIARKRAALDAVACNSELFNGLKLLYNFQREIEMKFNDASYYYKIIDNCIIRVESDKGSYYKLNILPIEIPLSAYDATLKIVLDGIHEKISMGMSDRSHVISYKLKKDIQLLLEALELRGVNAKKFLSDYYKNPIKPQGSVIKDDMMQKEVHTPQIIGMDIVDINIRIAKDNTRNVKERIIASWNAIVASIGVFSLQMSIQPPDNPSENADIIELRHQQKNAITIWFSLIRKQNCIYFSTQPLVDYIANQLIGVSEIMEKGRTGRKMDADLCYNNAQAFIDEVIYKITNK